jgi:hypothetical protein
MFSYIYCIVSSPTLTREPLRQIRERYISGFYIFEVIGLKVIMNVAQLRINVLAQ